MHTTPIINLPVWEGRSHTPLATKPGNSPQQHLQCWEGQGHLNLGNNGDSWKGKPMDPLQGGVAQPGGKELVYPFSLKTSDNFRGKRKCSDYM